MRAWLTPPSMPSAVQCRRLFIPDTELIRQAVYGALTELTKSYHWENGGTEPDDIADLMFDMVDEFLQEKPCMVGVIVPYITDDPPDRTLPMDGSTYDGDDYPELYAVIASALKNGDGTFTLPNLDETYLAQVSGGFGFCGIDGENEVSLDEYQMPGHYHSATVHTHTTGLAQLGAGSPVALPQTPTSVDTNSKGYGDPHNNMPRTFFCKFAVTAW